MQPQRSESSLSAVSREIAPEVHPLDDACIVFAKFGIAAQKLPGDTRAIKIVQHLGGFRRPPVSCPWHAGPPRSKALHEGGAKAIGEVIERGSPRRTDARCT